MAEAGLDGVFMPVCPFALISWERLLRVFSKLAQTLTPDVHFNSCINKLEQTY